MTEQWEKYYTKEQLLLLQKIELENLRVFIDLCEKLDLTYFLYGGTLLGVEKYNGLIPWDDDIDVALTRESYEKFVKLAPEILPEDYFIQNPYNCSECPYPYTKLRRRGTRYVEYANRNVKIDTGIYIDIYPVDRIPDDEALRKKQFRKVQQWLFFYKCRQIPLYDRKVLGKLGFLKRGTKWVICNGLKIFPQKYCMSKIDHYMSMYNNTKTKRYAALNSPNYDNIYEQLFPLGKGSFEGIEVAIPGDHKTHLKLRYGDYSQMPPEDERYGHVPYILDFGSYKEGEKNGSDI